MELNDLMNTDVRHYELGSRYKLQCFFCLPIYWLMGKFDYLLYWLRLTKPATFIYKGKFESHIKVHLPAKVFGSSPGSQWVVCFNKKLDIATLSYQLFIPENFEFVKGGKLPGLAGGVPICGGRRPNGHDGWSARYMFKEHGSICLYLYHPNMPEKYGHKIFLKNPDGSLFYLPRGKWFSIEQEITLNQPRLSDGKIITRIDGVTVLEASGMVFRTDNLLKIDKIFFSCFYGGGDISYAPAMDNFLCFKNFKVI